MSSSRQVGQTVPLDSVQEIGIITNNFTAEYGRADAGVINVTTKSGTNQFHGTLYEFNRVSDLASNSFNNNAYGLDKPHLHAQPVRLLGGRPDQEEQAVLLQQHRVDTRAKRGQQLQPSSRTRP